MVSIMPGIETTAPERTETSSGFSLPPSLRPVRSSKRLRPSAICSFSPSGHSPLLLLVSMLAVVVTVKPSGTGTPSRIISATPAPLPPSSDFMLASPSAMS